MSFFPLKPRMESSQNPDEAFFLVVILVIFIVVAITLKYLDQKGK